MKPSEILHDEASWTCATLARDENGIPCAYDDPIATCFCLSGAIARWDAPQAVKSKLIEHLQELIREWFVARRILKDPQLAPFNDHPEVGYKDVIELLRRAESQVPEISGGAA